MKLNKEIIPLKTAVGLFRKAFSFQRIKTIRFDLLPLNRTFSSFRRQKSAFRIVEKDYNFVMEASGCGIWKWNSKTNQIFYSAQAIKILELRPCHKATILKHWKENIYHEDRDRYGAALQKNLDKTTAFYEICYRIVIPDGTYKWILEKGKVAARDAKGTPTLIMGIHAEASAQKIKEGELSHTIALLRRQNNKLLNFSHVVSHNLNTYAGNIKMLLDLNDLKEYRSTTETLLHLRKVSDDLNETLGHLSQIIRIQNNPNIIIQPLQLNACLRKVLAVITTPGTENKVSIINNIPDNALIHFNPAYLESVLLNFCTNAIRYSHPDRHPIIKFDFFTENKQKVLTITDNGLGIDLEKYGHLLFGIYQTFHKHKEARGIGLYISKNQIEALNGAVSVTSTVGIGTCFSITFKD